MATYTGRIRRGLPRDRNGEPWPPVEQEPLEQAAFNEAAAGDAPEQAPSVAAVETPAQHPAAQPEAVTSPANAGEPTPADAAESAEAAEVVRAAEAVLAEHASATASEQPSREVSLRRGLPRVNGGEAWPPATTVSVAAAAAPKTGDAGGSGTPAPEAPAAVAPADTALETPAQQAQEVSNSAAPAAAVSTPTGSSAGTGAGNPGNGEPLRRGLPRVAGGEAWPPAGFAPKTTANAGSAQSQESTSAATAATASPASTTEPKAPRHAAPPASAPAAAAASKTAQASTEAPTAASAAPVAAKPTPKVQPAAAKPTTQPAAAKPKPAKKEPKRYGSRTLAGWIGFGVLWVVGAAAAAGIIVLAARGLTTFSAVQNFMARYPGEYELPATAEPGFPAWVRWSHFLNMFFIVLIIRSGLLVRRQQKPPAFWTPKNGKGAKISINLWLHQSLDLLWLLNGIVFVTLLFVTGHWMRIVPTSWEVFPNALSAMIQYMTLEWPVEDGWVNYNSLQQLMYFLVVFVAAPLAAITGARLSDLWPKKAVRLNKIYPVELARALHFPTMLFFVVFVITHVALVFSTGALKNLNHMYVGTPEISWVGFWIFAGSILAVAAAWFASKPMILAPIANLFGKVSSR